MKSQGNIGRIAAAFMSHRSLIFIPLLFSSAFGDLRSDLEPFLESHCYDCHDDIDAEGDLNLLDLKFDPSSPQDLKIWEEVFHRVELGEMPPKKKDRPEAGEMKRFLGSLEKPLTDAARRDLDQQGRVHGRRLTREEYENSLHDLLGIDVPLKDHLTADQEEGFENTSSHQQMSHFHLDSYLRAADVALGEAFKRAVNGDATYKKVYAPKILTTRRRGDGNYRGPEFRNGKAISWTMTLQFVGRMYPTRVPADGWYRVTIADVDAVNPKADGTVWGVLQSSSGSSAEPLLYPVGLIEATKNPTTRTYEAWIRKGHCLILKPDIGGAKNARISRGGNLVYNGQDLEKKGFQGIRFGEITVERIYPHATRWELRNKLFPGLNYKELKEPGFDHEAAFKRLISNFAWRAFRGQSNEERIKPYLALAKRTFAEKKDFVQALRSAYHAILCSPYFLTFVEKPGDLSGQALASRLSYLLWKSLPDDQLLKLAAGKKLHDPKVLSAQIERMLANKKSERFINSFTDQWLDLRKIDFTQPDPRRFPFFDYPLQQSMLAETRAFVRELIHGNHSVQKLLRADFAFLNSRLKRQYQLKNTPVKSGKGLQKVKVDPFARSGLLTQGAILKITADGSVTSPIVRGIWVNERILGRHIPPPPPNVPAVEPDIRGAVSIRDQLAKHSKEASCIGCHAKIDPAGFALESFDPIGQFRTKYGTKKTSAKVDPSGVTPDGLPFPGFQAWRGIYLKKPKMLARSFASQFLQYATGGEIYFSDRGYLDEIVEKSGVKGYGMKTLIHASLNSPIFLKK